MPYCALTLLKSFFSGQCTFSCGQQVAGAAAGQSEGWNPAFIYHLQRFLFDSKTSGNTIQHIFHVHQVT